MYWGDRGAGGCVWQANDQTLPQNNSVERIFPNMRHAIHSLCGLPGGVCGLPGGVCGLSGGVCVDCLVVSGLPGGVCGLPGGVCGLPGGVCGLSGGVWIA